MRSACSICPRCASGTPLPKPNTTYSGATFLANNGTTSSSDWTLLEFTGPLNPAFNHYWAGWDRTGVAPVCVQPSDPASTSGMCASIHHPGVDEKRITFIGQTMDIRQYLQPTAGSGTTHWYVHWDPSPPLLPGIQPPPTSVVPNVTDNEVANGAMIFVVPMLAAIAILTIFPQIALFLPHMVLTK